jgi:hypothetical protein
MGLASLVRSIWSDKQNVAYRPPQAYDGAGVGAYNIFNINGAVRILLLGGRATANAGAGATLRCTINGVQAEAAAVDIGTACITGEVWVSTLNVAGAMLGAVGGLPLTDALLHSKGFLAGDSVGVIVATFAVATWTGEIFCVYQKLTPASSITVV